MKVKVRQFYIEVGKFYPLSHIVQRLLYDNISAYTTVSEYVEKKYPDFTLVFNLSVKEALVITEIRGPAVSKKEKTVEYTIFLPFIEHDRNRPESLRRPLRLFLDAVILVLQRLQVDTTALAAASDGLIESILSHPDLIRRHWSDIEDK